MSTMFESSEWKESIDEIFRLLRRDHTGETLEVFSGVQDRIRELSGNCATLFGKSRGWTRQKSFFEGRLPRLFTDHTYYFAGAGADLSAITGHLYDFDRDADDAQRWASEHGLGLEVLGKASSWHFPHRTTLVVYHVPADWRERLIEYLSPEKLGRRWRRARPQYA